MTAGWDRDPLDDDLSWSDVLRVLVDLVRSLPAAAAEQLRRWWPR